MAPKFYEKLNGTPSAIIGVLVLAGAAYFGFYTYRNVEAEKLALLTDLESARGEQYRLLREIDARQEIIDSFSGQISNITNTVGDLTKLAATDEELLKKYSKIYFLNENYIPSRLVDIEEDYLVDTATNYQIHADVWPHLENLLEEAEEDGLNLKVASAYRSFGTQSALKSAYSFIYGSGANAFSADQGYSEHQLGTTLDFSSGETGISSTFVSSPEYKWLQDNAHDFGFTLSYPQNNAYYKFEPWHWRYVGRELASDLHDEGKYFYDLDQREIDTYLIKIFD